MSGLHFDFDAEAHWTPEDHRIWKETGGDCPMAYDDDGLHWPVDVSLYEEEGKRADAERFRDTIVDLYKFSVDHIKKKKEEWYRDRQANKIIREDVSGVYVPQYILLSDIKLWAWQYKVNRKDYPETYKHIVEFLNKYVDSLKKNKEEKQADLNQIADAINQNRIWRNRDSNYSFEVNPHSEDIFRPEGKPFFLLPPGGEAGMYESVACFLDSEYVQMLKKCEFCNGLFIAPDKFKYKFCPGTDHGAKQKSEHVSCSP